MEKSQAKRIAQPWRKSLLLRQAVRSFGQALIVDVGNTISSSYAKYEYDSNHQLRIDLFRMLGRYLDQESLDENEFANLTNLLEQLDYSEVDIQAVLQFLRKLKEKETIYISKTVEMINTYQIVDSLKAINEDYHGFVMKRLPSREEKLAVLEYIKEQKTTNLHKLIDPDLVEIIDLYIEDDITRDRMIVLLEVETMV